MYKKLMFLISFVCLLGLSASVSADALKVDWGTTHTVTGYEEYDYVEVEGLLIIESTGELVANGESRIDGDGGDGGGGSEYAEMIINGGSFICNDRFNIGCDHDGWLTINDGGSFLQQDSSDGFKFPDNDGGEHRIFINSGTLECYRMEFQGDRDAEMYLGCDAPTNMGKVIVNNIEYGPGDYKHDPQEWYNDGYLFCQGGCAGPTVNYFNGGDDGGEAFCFELSPEASSPDPADGEDGIPVGVVCTWTAGDMGDPHVGDKHYLFFGTGWDDVNDAGLLDPERCAGFKPVGLEELDPDVDCSCTLVLWTNYYWRIDEKPFGGDTAKGNVWTFTTGCEVMPGDINLDCVVDGTDYAMLADDWMSVSFFPDDF